MEVCMNNKQFYTLLGVIFIVGSGIVYGLEKISTYIYWQGQIATGQFPTTPQFNFFTQNFFYLLFLVVGIILIGVAFKIQNKQK